MRFRTSIMLFAAAALVSAGCEVHEEGPAALQGEVAVGEPAGPVIEGPGVVAVDAEPDPSLRTYVYDEGYPPGTYLYDNYYYYGGYRYPRDVFVDRYVRENVRHHRYTEMNANRQAGQRIEQIQRAGFAKTHGKAPGAAVRHEAARPEAARPHPARPEAAPTARHEAARPESARVAPPEAARREAAPARPEAARPEAAPPARREAPPAARPEAARPENKAPAREPARPIPEEHRRDEGK